MSEMVERVTYAIKAEMGRQLSAQPLHGDVSDWHASGGSLDLELLGRAAIEEIREPTEGMIKVLRDADNGDDHRIGEFAGRALWATMIDEMLK